MFKITFNGKTTAEAELENEASLLAAASKAQIDLTHRCGGHARCGTCRVVVESGQENLSPAGASETRILGILKAESTERLACQAWARGEVCCRVENS
jgi:ferredoxin